MTGFPSNVVDEIVVTFRQHLLNHEIIDRPLRLPDPARCVGVYAVDMAPDQQNAALIGQSEPVVNRYNFRIQNMVKATNEPEARALFTLDSKSIRVILYRDNQLLVRLKSLTEELLGTRERFQRFGVSRQRFLNNELKGHFVYLAQTDIWVETDLVRL